MLQNLEHQSLKITVPSAWQDLEDVVIFLDYTISLDKKEKRYVVSFHTRFVDQICVVKDGKATFPVQEEKSIISYASFPENPNIEKILEIIFNSLDYWLEDYQENPDTTLTMFGYDLYENIYCEGDFPEYQVENLGEK